MRFNERNSLSGRVDNLPESWSNLGSAHWLITVKAKSANTVGSPERMGVIPCPFGDPVTTDPKGEDSGRTPGVNTPALIITNNAMESPENRLS